MTNSKNTKRALLASVLSVVLCFAMLVGSTFAWFTDSASTGVNKIVAGNLAIDLVDESGNSLEGKTLGWVAYDGREQEAILWEPGCTYNMESFYIKNNGNLNLKFKFSVSGIQGDAKLLEAIDFTAMADAGWFKFNTGAVSIKTEGEFDLFKGFDVDTLFYGTKHFDEYVLEPGQTVGPIVISGHMKEEAGNEYRGLSIDGIAITLVATQATGEEDSFNGVYDADAEYPVTDSAELADKLTAAQPGETVALASGSFDLPDVVNEGVTISGDSAESTKLKVPATASGANKTGFIVNQPDLTIRNVTIDGNSSITGNEYCGAIDIQEGGTALDGVTFRNIPYGACAIVVKSGVGTDESVTITNTTISGGFKPINIVDGANGTVNIENTEITGTYTFNVNSASSQNLVINVTGSKLHGWTSYGDIKSASFTNTEFSKGGSDYNFLRPYADTTLTNCTFDATFTIGAGATGKTYTINNCTKDGTLISAENVQNLLLDMTGSDGTNLRGCTIVVDGVTVTLS